MTLTADQVYDLVKHDETSFPLPAPYTTIDVGVLDVGSGVFTGLRTESERDPEPIEHLPGQHPHNPPPHFVGSRWLSITIDATWHQTITWTPAPKVPLAPVLLRFAVTTAPTAWSVTAAGRTRVAPAGQTVLLVDVWDAAIANWTLTAGAVTVQDGLRLQRPVGPPPAGLGAFTIPVLPLSLVYAPPADTHGQSTAAYSTGHTVGTSVDVGLAHGSSSSVPVQAVGFVGQIQGFVGGLRAEAAGLQAAGAQGVADVYTKVADQLGQVTSSHQVDVTDGFDLTMTVSQSTTDTTGTTASAGGPGDGDVLHFYKDVRMVWSYVDGRLRLCPIDAVEVLTTVRGLRNDPHGLAPADVTALLALDPFGTDAAAAVLPADRFLLVEHLEYGHGATLVRTVTTTRDTKQQVTHSQVTTDHTLGRWADPHRARRRRQHVDHHDADQRHRRRGFRHRRHHADAGVRPRRLHGGRRLHRHALRHVRAAAHTARADSAYERRGRHARSAGGAGGGGTGLPHGRRAGRDLRVPRPRHPGRPGGSEARRIGPRVHLRPDRGVGGHARRPRADPS